MRTRFSMMSRNPSELTRGIACSVESPYFDFMIRNVNRSTTSEMAIVARMPMASAMGQGPADHCREHEQRRNGEIQEVENTNRQGEGDGYGHVDAAQHQAIDDL